MELTENTKLSEILAEYPWMEEEAVKIDEKFAILKTPMGKILARKTTLKNVCEIAHVDLEDVIATFRKMLEEHDAEQNTDSTIQ